MAFKATRAKSGLFEIHGIEAFIEKKVAELKNALGIGKKPEVKVAPKAAAPVTAVARKKAAKPAKKPSADPLAALNELFNAHPKKAALIKAGKKKDQLLRSLIPLYVAGDGIDVSSGTTSKFWAKHGVKYAAPNVAKAFRTHPGNVKRTSRGPRITPAGVKYVEAAL